MITQRRDFLANTMTALTAVLAVTAGTCNIAHGADAPFSY